MTPSVLIAGTVFENDYQLGIWRVFYEVMRRTAKDVCYRLLVESDPVQPVPPGVEVVKIRYKSAPRLRNVRSWIRFRRGVRKVIGYGGGWIWHPTFFELDPHPWRKSIVTVHDFIAERYFYLESGLRWQVPMKRRVLERADIVLPISSQTEADFRAFYPAWKGKSMVIGHGSEHLGDAEQEQASAAKCPVDACFLYVGLRVAYKNFLVVLEALRSPVWPKGFSLVVVGSPFTAEEEGLVRYYGVEDKIHHVGAVSDEDLRGWYQTAKGLIFPSLLEGFGIPVIEAQRLGCVPVLSDIPVFHEVAGDDGALFFDPHSPRGLAGALHEALKPEVAARVRKLGERNCANFSWDRAAELTYEAYRELASGREKVA